LSPGRIARAEHGEVGRRFHIEDLAGVEHPVVRGLARRRREGRPPGGGRGRNSRRAGERERRVERGVPVEQPVGGEVEVPGGVHVVEDRPFGRGRAAQRGGAVQGGDALGLERRGWQGRQATVQGRAADRQDRGRARGTGARAARVGGGDHAHRRRGGRGVAERVGLAIQYFPPASTRAWNGRP